MNKINIGEDERYTLGFPFNLSFTRYNIVDSRHKALNTCIFCSANAVVIASKSLYNKETYFAEGIFPLCSLCYQIMMTAPMIEDITEHINSSIEYAIINYLTLPELHFSRE